MSITAKRITMHAVLESAQVLRVAFVGCGSHAFRNIFPCFQFLPLRLIACCDLDLEKAQAFARQFAAESAYRDVETMLARETLDAVFIVTGYDERGRPRYPDLAEHCLAAGVHVWIEKPPAAAVLPLQRLKSVAAESAKLVAVGFKKMFMPANQKALALLRRPGASALRQVLLQYPQYVPDVDDCKRYVDGEKVASVVSFLDHLCHPMSALQLFMGDTLRCYLDRNASGCGSLICHGGHGVIAHIGLTHGQAINAGMEQTTLICEGEHIVVENNLKVSLRRNPRLGYGDNPNFYQGNLAQSSLFWEPEFSLGQMYNKGICLIGYYHELEAFCQSILEGRALAHGHLDDGIAITAVFEAILTGGCGKDLEVIV